MSRIEVNAQTGEVKIIDDSDEASTVVKSDTAINFDQIVTISAMEEDGSQS